MVLFSWKYSKIVKLWLELDIFDRIVSNALGTGLPFTIPVSGHSHSKKNISPMDPKAFYTYIYIYIFSQIVTY
jgi:hypothetical protein